MQKSKERNVPILFLVLSGLAGIGCAGVVVPDPTSRGVGSSSGATSGGDAGTADGLGSGVTPAPDSGRAAPGPGGSDVPPVCAPGAACQPRSGCATSAAVGGNACAESCTCDATGHFQCVEECVDASTPTGCEQGAACTANTGCGGGSTGGGCTFSCSCDATGHMQCSQTCPPPVDAGCAQNVLCVRGDHWDRTACRCVPDACVSQVGGPCQGFVVTPCQCASGLVCMTSGIPDVGGTCQAPQGPADEVDGSTADADASASDGPLSSDTCQVAADCGKGRVLPALCLTCSDGGLGCAHWTCIANSCQAAFCE